jgi:hypothetical protein
LFNVGSVDAQMPIKENYIDELETEEEGIADMMIK